MMTTISLAPVIRSLEQNACTLDQLWLDFAVLWQKLGWEQAQVKLWLHCQPGIGMTSAPSYESRANPDDADVEVISYRLWNGVAVREVSLADQLFALLESAGKPLPLQQLMNKLPAGLLVTEVMVRTAINNDTRLSLMGPLVKLA